MKYLSGMINYRFSNNSKPGDMTSLTWTKSFFSKEAIQVTYSALNFRDPMVASRRLNVSTLPYDGNTSNLSENYNMIRYDQIFACLVLL